jgi:putative acetyltransferase
VAIDQRIIIRAETRADHGPIAEVVEQAFGSPAEARLVDAIRGSDHYIADLALVATIGVRIVGHVMISGCTIVGNDTTTAAVMLSPLAVDPVHQRMGIGGLLVRAVADRAVELRHPFVVLEGDPRYYSRFGFEPAARFGVELPLPDWAPPEAAQLLRLRDDASIPAGRVAYPDSFAVLDH